MEYKEKYYRLLVTFWVMLIIGLCFFGYTFKTLDQLDKNIKDFKIERTIQTFIAAGWIPYEKTKRRK